MFYFSIGETLAIKQTRYKILLHTSLLFPGKYFTLCTCTVSTNNEANNSYLSLKNFPLSSLLGGEQGVLLSLLVSAKRGVG